MSFRRNLRPLAALAASLSAAIAVVACGGGGAGPSPTSEAALRAARPGELVAQFKARMGQRMTRYPGPILVGTAGSAVDGVTGASAASYSGTNLQEAGVDEDDLLKTDGRFMYAMHPGYGYGADLVPARLEARRIQPDGSLGPGRGVALDAPTYAMGMYLLEDAGRIAVMGMTSGPQTSLDVFALSDDAAPAHATQVQIDGSMISSRRIGNVLYLATTWGPDLSRFWLPYDAPAAQVEAKLAGMTAGDLLPKIRMNGGAAQPLVTEEDCRLQTGDASLSLQVTTITAIDLSTPALERRSVCFLGSGQTLYMSTTAAYVASSRSYWLAADFAALWFPTQATTDIHKFALQDLQIEYRGSGEVTGHLGWDPEKAPYRMSEFQGDLRVLTYTGETGWGATFSIAMDIGSVALASPQRALRETPATPPSPATLTVLREDAATGRLAQVAKLPNAKRPAALGREGEQVYAVQFAGPLAYVVTFRKVDPLYVLDLSDPTDPRTAGELTVPGYSDYLFPLANGKLLGIGKDATEQGLMQGLKVALFDINDPAQPALLSSLSLGGRGSTSALDHSRHGINIFQQGDKARIALPVRVVTGSGDTYKAVQGLARFAVDTTAGTLLERPMVGATAFDTTDWTAYARFNLANERSIQAAAATYYLSGGQLSFTTEP